MKTSNFTNFQLYKLFAFVIINSNLITFNSLAQSVGINSMGTAPNSSALLDIDAAPGNNKGLLIPRVSLTLTSSNAPIGATIATSLLVYNIAAINDVAPGYYYWDGTKWVRFTTGIGGGNEWVLTGNIGTNPATNFLGTTDSVDFVLKTNNTEKMRILSNGKIGIGTTSPIAQLQLGGTYSTFQMGSSGSVSDNFHWVNENNGTNRALRLYNGNVGAATQLFTIVNTGSVGIGTATPLAQLHTTSTVRFANYPSGANGAIVRTNNTGDLSITNFSGNATDVLLGNGTFGPAPGGSGWGLTGNSATNPATNFIGTTDLNDFVIKTNGLTRMYVVANSPAYQPRIAIGDFNNPEANLEIRESVASLYIRSYNSNALDPTLGSVLALQRHRGAIGAGTPPLAGDGLGQLDFRGGLSSSISGVTAASIKSYATANWGGSTRGADLRFYTINTTTGGSIFNYERMIITGNGQIGINTASTTNAQLDVRGTGSTSATFSLGVRNSANTWMLSVRDDGKVGVNTTAPTASLSVNGSADKPGGGTWAVFSDERLKQNVQPFSDGLEKLLQIKPVTFQYNGKAGITTKEFYVGVVAQQIQKIIPYTVKEVEMLMDPNDKNSTASILQYDPNALIYILVNAIKEQQNIIKQQQSDIDNIKIQLKKGNQ